MVPVAVGRGDEPQRRAGSLQDRLDQRRDVLPRMSMKLTVGVIVGTIVFAVMAFVIFMWWLVELS